MHLLGTRDYNQLTRKMKVSKSELGEILQLMQSLNPRPGAQYNTEQPEYVIPDVFVFKHRDRWRVELNSDVVPKLRVNPVYAGLIQRADTSDDNTSMRNHLQSAVVYETSRAVVKPYSKWPRSSSNVSAPSLNTARNMRPMVLHDAEALKCTNQRSIVEPHANICIHRGIFELKYFFRATSVLRSVARRHLYHPCGYKEIDRGRE